MTTSAQLPQLPFRQSHPLKPPVELRRLQSRGTIQQVRTQVNDEAWLVTDYMQVRQLLDDDRLGRSHPNPEAAARSGESVLSGGPQGDFQTEVADHARLRKVLVPHFSPKHLRTLVPRIEALTAGLLDDMIRHGAPADLHAKLALPLPILVICELLGVPYSDRDEFLEWTQDASNVHDRTRSESGMAKLFEYGMALVKRKRTNPSDDVISRLAASDSMTDVEAAISAIVLLFAGHETTMLEIGWGTLLLLTNPAQWRALVDNPTLVPDAVEELLRGSLKNGFVIPRYARTGLKAGGVSIAAGDLVLLDIGTANHDPAVFSSPNSVDLSRHGSSHLSFGYGGRYCIGAPLARIELKIVFSQLISRFPSLRLAADPTTLAVRTDVLAPALVALPVSW